MQELERKVKLIGTWLLSFNKVTKLRIKKKIDCEAGVVIFRCCVEDSHIQRSLALCEPLLHPSPVIGYC